MISDRQFLWLYDNLNICNTKQHQNYYTLTLRCSQHCNTCFVPFPVRACTIISGPFLCCAALLCFCQSCSFSSAVRAQLERRLCSLFTTLLFLPLLPGMLQHMHDLWVWGNRGVTPDPWGLKKEENVSKSLWCFRIYDKSKPFRDTAQSHEGDNCGRKVRWVQKQQQKSSYFSTDSFLKSSHVDVQYRFEFSIRNHSNGVISQCEVEYYKGSIKLCHVSPTHLQVQLAQSSFR